jgi:hypothetical protein
MCINKKWNDILKCQYIQEYLGAEGKHLKINETVIVGVAVLKKRFMVFRNIKTELHFGFLRTKHVEAWGIKYGGSKSV